MIRTIVNSPRLTLLLLASCLPCGAQGEEAAATVAVASPSGTFSVTLSIEEGGRPSWRVERRGQEVMATSGLGYRLAGDVDVTRGFQSLEQVSTSEHDSIWRPVWGERSAVRDRYRTTRLRFRRDTAPSSLDIELRAYDEGVAVCYIFEKPLDTESLEIASEETEFRFAEDAPLWAVYSAQGKYARVPISAMEHSVERPCILEPSSGGVIAIAEAALDDYARMRLRRSESSEHTLVSKLHGPVVAQSFPFRSPWRVVLAADDAGKLLEQNDIFLNLNEPCALEDTSWIRPGKVIREVTLSTEGGKACVDFCVRYGLQYIEYDAGWYGPEGKEESDARTVSRRGLDLLEVIRYARSHGIGVFVYVNRRHLERQLDELLPLYRSWGLAGIKFGFVQHGSQKWTRWMHEAIRKCAEYEMLVDVHDEYRMTGWQRTYPNFLTAEGIGGDETRPPHEQALANLFNRMLCGPADHTFCYYNGYVDATASHASQLAKSVCFFSPLQFLFWYDRPSSAADEPELQFFRHLPTTWDETRVLRSKPGQYAVVARRKGRDWFLGCLNAVERRSFDIPLDFLPEGTRFQAEIWRDDDSVATRTKVGLERREVDQGSVLEAELSTPGGLAMRLVPVP